MIDFHSHILWDVDDGSRSFEESKNMLEEALKFGFDKIISTSHYKENRFEVDEEQRKEKIAELQNENTIQIFLGNEILATENTIKLLSEHKASTINNSKYILIEFSLRDYSQISKDYIYSLIENDYIPIIAHPERYLHIQKHPEYVKELFEMGALFQGNYGSILGIYGRQAKKTFKILLKNNLISFLGSDAHHENIGYKIVPKALKKISKLVTNEKLQMLTNDNAQMILENKKI